jgi:hypothetical protein
MQLTIHVTPDEHEQLRAIADALAQIHLVRAELTSIRKTIEPEDNPATGIPQVPWSPTGLEEPVSTATATEKQAAAVIFGGGNVAVPLAPSGVQMPPTAALPTTSAASPLTPATAETEAPNPTPPQVDARGLPWDARIHAGTKALNADGTWRAKRGVNDAAFVARIEAELRQIMAAPAAAVPPMPAPFITQEAAAVGIPQVPQAAAAAPVGVHPLDFSGLMQKATQLMAAQKLTRDELEQCAQRCGLPSIVGAVQRVDLVPTISAHIDALVSAKG